MPVSTFGKEIFLCGGDRSNVERGEALYVLLLKSTTNARTLSGRLSSGQRAVLMAQLRKTAGVSQVWSLCVIDSDWWARYR